MSLIKSEWLKTGVKYVVFDFFFHKAGGRAHFRLREYVVWANQLVSATEVETV